MALIKTKNPETLTGRVVTMPSGNNPWYLVNVDHVPAGLENDVVTDTAAFLSQFDLSEPEANEDK